MQSPKLNVALQEKLIKFIDHIDTSGGCGNIEGVEFDLRHKDLNLRHWSILNIMQNILHLPNESDKGIICNQQGLWFPWFGHFSAEALRARILKLGAKSADRMLKGIVAGTKSSASDKPSVDQLIELLTPKYFVETGDKLSLYEISDVVAGGDHLHEHDRIFKAVSIKITKADGSTIKVEPPYKVFGQQTVINPHDETAEPFGSILYRIVHFQKLARPNQLRRFKRGESDISSASAIAYALYKVIEPAWNYYNDEVV